MTPPCNDERRKVEAACRDTIQRSAHHADRHEAHQLAALFTVDAHLQRPGGQWLQGRAAIEAAYAARPGSAITRHLVVTPLVEIDAQDSRVARATSTVLVWRGSSEDAEGPQGRPAHGAQLLGEFIDLLRCDTADGCWRIAERQARFLLHAGGSD